MPVGSRTQVGISISIARDPALVRTVRLVAAAVARRAAPSEDVVEEVRLAVGEACAVMVGGMTVPAEGDGLTREEKVRLQLDIGDRLYISLSCRGEEAASYDGSDIDPWALLRGLAEDLVVTAQGGTTTVTMSWPL